MVPKREELPLQLQEWKQFSWVVLEMIQYQTEETELDLDLEA